MERSRGEGWADPGVRGVGRSKGEGVGRFRAEGMGSSGGEGWAGPGVRGGQVQVRGVGRSGG